MAFDTKMNKPSRLDKDRRTLEAIGRIYCSAHHKETPKGKAGLCSSCRETIDRTLEHTTSCPFGHEGNCQDCSIHCQRGEAQVRIREMMSYAAPRMAYRHPLMTFEYLRKKLRSVEK